MTISRNKNLLFYRRKTSKKKIQSKYFLLKYYFYDKKMICKAFVKKMWIAKKYHLMQNSKPSNLQKENFSLEI